MTPLGLTRLGDAPHMDVIFNIPAHIVSLEQLR